MGWITKGGKHIFIKDGKGDSSKRSVFVNFIKSEADKKSYTLQTSTTIGNRIIQRTHGHKNSKSAHVMPDSKVTLNAKTNKVISREPIVKRGGYRVKYENQDALKRLFNSTANESTSNINFNDKTIRGI